MSAYSVGDLPVRCERRAAKLTLRQCVGHQVRENDDSRAQGLCHGCGQRVQNALRLGLTFLAPGSQP